MNEFLSKSGLYQIYTLWEDYYIGNQDFTDPTDFHGKTFDYWCEKEEALKTFELTPDEASCQYFGMHRGDQIHPDNFIDEKLNYTFLAIGNCKSCGEYKVYFALNVFSNNPISNVVDSGENINFYKKQTEQYPGTKIFVQKIGAFPEIKRTPNKLISNYFDRETGTWYYKGINALDKNFGIGAFAYFRRIIEKELIHLIESIKLLPDSQTQEIQKLLDKHNENPRVSTIYENIFEYLPGSLKSLGENPFKLLYNQTSEGLHALTEQECLEKAESILKILEFVIRKINEEKSEIMDLRLTIKALK